MSSHKRNREREKSALSADTSKQEASLETVTDGIYAPSSTYRPLAFRIYRIPIDKIIPNPIQPRRVMPSTVRAHWDGRYESLPEVFEQWVKVVEAESKTDFNIAWYLEEFEDDDIENIEEEIAERPLEANFIKLIALAADIRRNGLTLPITVVNKEEEYWLETGERRWLAFCLLSIFYPDGNWKGIPARIVDSMDLWRQASENNMRSDLNAIARARQLALLLMEMYGWDNFRSLESIVAAEGSEREFYAQVSDGERWRIPRGKGEQLLRIIGLSDPGQLRQYRALLRVPDEVWVRADDENWTENRLRPYTVTAVALEGKSISEDVPPDGLTRVELKDWWLQKLFDDTNQRHKYERILETTQARSYKLRDSYMLTLSEDGKHAEIVARSTLSPAPSPIPSPAPEVIDGEEEDGGDFTGFVEEEADQEALPGLGEIIARQIPQRLMSDLAREFQRTARSTLSQHRKTLALLGDAELDEEEIRESRRIIHEEARRMRDYYDKITREFDDER